MNRSQKIAEAIAHNENIREQLPCCTYCNTSQEDVMLIKYRNEPICPKCLRDEVYEGSMTMAEYNELIENHVIDDSQVKELVPDPDPDYIYDF